MKEKFINWLIKFLKADTNKISDGFHTFDELYNHRIILWIKLCHFIASWTPVKPWRTKRHSDGSIWDGWFLLGLYTEKGSQMTYHLPSKYWKMCKFAETLKKAPEFDGHTPKDVIKRLKSL